MPRELKKTRVTVKSHYRRGRRINSYTANRWKLPGRRVRRQLKREGVTFIPMSEIPARAAIQTLENLEKLGYYGLTQFQLEQAFYNVGHPGTMTFDASKQFYKTFTPVIPDVAEKGVEVTPINEIVEALKDFEKEYGPGALVDKSILRQNIVRRSMLVPHPVKSIGRRTPPR